MPKVFVTDGRSRKSLAVVRSLGEKGIEVTVGEETRVALSFYSKYCARSIVYPSPRKDPLGFVEFLLQGVKKKHYDCLFPINDESLLLVARHRDEFMSYTRVPVARIDTVGKAFDKRETLLVARKSGIPCPETFFIDDLRAVREFSEKLNYPVVIKPRESCGSRGIKYVTSRNDLIHSYQEVHRHFSYPLIQEYIPPGGGTYGVSALFNANSEPRAIFVHRRLREYPVSGGPSTLRESVTRADIMDLGVRLLKALKWYGVAMVEFKVDPRDGQAKLMEVNPRFWGSLRLTIASGVDFPYLLYRLAIEGDIEPVLDYKVGVRCRWLWPGDILHFISSPGKFDLLPQFFDFFRDGTNYDILSLKDPAPAMAMGLGFFECLFSKERRRYVLREA